MIVAEDIRVAFRLGRQKRFGEGFKSPIGARINYDKRYAQLMALDGVSFEIPEGSCVGLIGANGAGKSTLLRVLAEILPVTSGSVKVRRPVSAMLSRSLGLVNKATGAENVRLMAACRGIPRTNYKMLVEDVTEFCELGGYMDLPVSSYSSGMRSRLAFGMVTALPAETLIIDEIIGTGDEAFRERASARFRSVVNRSGTVMVATHSKQLLADLTSQTIWLDHGKLRMFDNTKETLAAYVTEMRKRRSAKIDGGGKLHSLRSVVHNRDTTKQTSVELDDSEISLGNSDE